MLKNRHNHPRSRRPARVLRPRAAPIEPVAWPQTLKKDSAIAVSITAFRRSAAILAQAAEHATHYSTYSFDSFKLRSFGRAGQVLKFFLTICHEPLGGKDKDNRKSTNASSLTKYASKLSLPDTYQRLKIDRPRTKKELLKVRTVGGRNGSELQAKGLPISRSAKRRQLRDADHPVNHLGLRTLERALVVARSATIGTSRGIARLRCLVRATSRPRVARREPLDAVGKRIAFRGVNGRRFLASRFSGSVPRRVGDLSRAEML